MIFHWGGNANATNEYYIEQYYFSFSNDIDIHFYSFKEHQFYPLKEAYDLGLIDIKDVGQINERYNRCIDKQYK